jgi:hypothetical protein
VPDLKARRKNTAAVLLGCTETVEMADGYALRYPDTSAWDKKLNTFNANWRRSSPMLHFTRRREADTNCLWLEITGPEGTKAFVEGARYILASHINPPDSLKLRLRQAMRYLTSPLRVKPDFLVIGAKKCGTTALYDYMTQHPAIAPALRKEVAYFNQRHLRGQYSYRAFFPTVFARVLAKGDRGGLPLLTGEATPDYLCSQECPARVRQLTPDAQLIVILRNPVERAYSLYNHNLRAGLESRSFEEAIDAEEKRVVDMQERLGGPAQFGFMHHSYMTRGIYVDQLARWSDLFPSKQLHVLRTEDLYQEPEATLRKVFDTLDLPYNAPAKFRKINTTPYNPMDPKLRRGLEEYFAPHNARLAEFLGTDLFW